MPPPREPRRIVSLVPSLTETLVHFGLADQLVGRTRYCVEPADAVSAIETVGGTKNPDVARIVALAPDLVILNREENRLEDWQALIDAGLDVLVTHPRTVADAAEMIEELGQRAGAPDAGQQLARDCRDSLRRAVEWRAGRKPIRAFCPIWRNPWMTFRCTTYIGSMLAAVGLENIYARAQVLHTADQRTNDSAGDFFEIDIADAIAREPQVIVLPDEPYVFARKHGEELRALGAKGELIYVDGKDLSWYGPRIPAALERLEKITFDISRL